MARTMSSVRNERICALYVSGNYTTTAIASAFGLSRRRVLQLVKEAGLVRTAAESNRVVTPLKPKHRIHKPRDDRAVLPIKRRDPPSVVRYLLLKHHPWCTVCGARPENGIRLDLDHVDNNPLNNHPENFQVLCTRCNVGKYHAEAA